MLYSAISTGSSFTQVAPETWFWLAMPFLPPLFPLPAAPGLVVCGARGAPKLFFGGMPTPSTGAPQGQAGARPAGRRGAAGLAVPWAVPVAYRLSRGLSGAARMFRDALKSIFAPTPPTPHSHTWSLQNLITTS